LLSLEGYQENNRRMTHGHQLFQSDEKQPLKTFSLSLHISSSLSACIPVVLTILSKVLFFD
jgi:hypothetical protein